MHLGTGVNKSVSKSFCLYLPESICLEKNPKPWDVMLDSSHLYQLLPPEAHKKKSYIWENTALSFNELLIGWNAQRPYRGQFHISLSLKIEDWSPWFSYALWGANGQRSFEHQHGPFKIFQDTICIDKGYLATGWRVKVEAKQMPNLQRFHAFYAAIVPSKKPVDINKNSFMQGSYICLEVPGMSQIAIKNSCNMRLCSPTSTTAVIHYLNKQTDITPMEFAHKVWDSYFDIYGHWVFAMAQAYVELGEEWETRVMYLNDFEDVYRFLKTGYPVVVSVKGRLPGSLHPYNQGHLLVVRGFDPIKNKVLCMDPAYPKNSNTYVTYALNDFVSSWQRRKNVAYLFKRRIHRINIPIG